jgi:hypothetical protein
MRKKVKFTLHHAVKSHGGRQRFSFAVFLTAALDRGGWSTPLAGRFTPGKETGCSFYRRLGGPQGPSGRVRKISPPPGFETLTVHPVASRSPGPRLLHSVIKNRGLNFCHIFLFSYVIFFVKNEIKNSVYLR